MAAPFFDSVPHSGKRRRAEVSSVPLGIAPRIAGATRVAYIEGGGESDCAAAHLIIESFSQI
eukprot:6960996-Lingulodinium_polyedra.AAC.1